MKIAYPLSILVATIIFFMCIIQMPDEIPPEFQIPYMDKFVHLLMYLGLTGMLFIENFKKKNNCTWKDVWLFLSGKMKNAKFYPVTGKPIIFLSLLSLGYGGLIEIIQEYFSLNRTGDWFDFLADAFGIIIAICILTAFQRARLNPSSIKNT